MKRHFLQLLAAVFAFLCLSASSYAQLPPELEQGLKDFEFYHTHNPIRPRLSLAISD